MQIYNSAVIAYFMICKEQIGEIRAPFSIDFICCEILLQLIIEYFMRVSMLISWFFLDGQPNGDQALCSYIYERWYYCKNNLYAPDRLSYSDSRQLNCANDIFPESVLGLRL